VKKNNICFTHIFFFYSFEKTYIVSKFNEYQNSKNKIFSTLQKKNNTEGEGGGGGERKIKNKRTLRKKSQRMIGLMN
jgi:hypothetical protein